VVAADGKKLRRSQDGSHERDGIWMVSAWASENRMVLGQRKVDDNKLNGFTYRTCWLENLLVATSNQVEYYHQIR
jgi:hypothetical protein